MTFLHRIIEHIQYTVLLLLGMFCISNSAYAITYNVTNTTDGIATNQLRGAILAADAAGPGPHTINVAAGTYNLTMGMIEFGNNAQNISIIGAGVGQTIINMTTTNQDVIFLINPPGTNSGIVTNITGITFTNGYSSNYAYGGGAIVCGGPGNVITITHCAFEGNTSVNTGGGAIFFASAGIINIDQCSFTNNTTSNYSGGAVNISYYSYSGLTFPITGSASITNCSFTGNSAKNSGGAIYIDAQKNHNNAISFNTVIQNNTFTGNSTTTLDDPTSGRGRGGAIYIDTDFPAVVNYNYFSNNTTVSYPKNALFVSQGYTWGGGATVDATNNWWGCNTDPQATGTCSETAIVQSGSNPTTLITQPQLVLKTTAGSNTLCTANGTTVTGSVFTNSANTTMSLANISRLIGMPLTFSATNGTINNAQATIQANGTATATYTATTAGTGTVKALAGYMTSGNTTQAANITVNASPVITAQPVNVASCGSGSASMSITATGGALTYQWYKGSTPLTNNSVISGATSATLTFTNPGASYNATDYKVTVTNGCGNVTSSDASLILYNSVNRLYVATGGTGNGSSWGSAMGDLHTALLAAAGCNSITEIFVANGIYNVGANSFVMRNNLAIYGGFDPLNGITDLTHNRIMPNAANSQGSILNGQSIRPVIWNVFTAATAMDNTAVLDGFTITGGSYSEGAGIRNVYASPTLRNLVIKGNNATVSGAGIYNSASSPFISNSVISGNLVLNAASNVSGAGIMNTNFSTPTITNVTITGNSLTSALGVLSGAGMYNSGFSVPVVHNSIIWNNLKNNNPAIAGADIENNAGNITLKHSITQGYTTGNANDYNLVNTDPLFVGTGFQLSNTSPAINAGSNAFYAGLATSKDLAGSPRLAGLVIDMGAYENQSVLTPDANLIIYVREGFTGNGSSWANATSNLQGAINSGATKVFVAVGTYSVPLPNSFRLKTGVAVYGGFDPVNNITDLTHNRILPNQGTAEGSVLTANNAGRVMDNIGCDNTAVLDGFTITGGYAETWSAGIYNHHNASPTLTNLVIKGNTSYYVGSSTSYGGGIACWVQSSPIISNVIIKGNSAKIGAGVFVQAYSHPVITNTLITDNHVSAGGTGGGIALDNVDVSAILNNVTIAGNTGGVADALAINNTNTMDIKNSIVFGSILTVGSGTYTAQHSFIEGNSSTTNGNIDATGISVADIFTNPSAGDYNLRGAAFVVNKGNNTLFTGLSAATKDLAGNARLNGTDIDLGAYEFFIQPGANSIAYVRPAATGLGNGSSWADATGLLQLAIDGTNVQKVYVATGNYPVGNHSFIMKNNVEIYGGFNPANNTTDWNTRTLPNKGLGDGSVLDGQNVRPVIWNYNNGLNTTAILDGFTLTNGTGSNGGAMYNYNTAPAFNNLVIRNNSATRGGGIYNQTASITLNNAVIKDNTVSNDGGGMYNVTNSSPVMTNVAFTGNTANNGGGMFSVTNSSPVVTNALFANNTAVNTGGAIINMTIDPLQLTNVTIANNTGTDPVYSTGTGSITFHNSIVFGTVSGPYTAQHSLVEGSSATANGNIDATGISAADVFTDNATGDYTLKNTSPAVNAGNNLLNNTATDLAGNARITGTNIDMGAYEQIIIAPDANGIIYVKQTATGTQDGSSWDNATADLHNAIHTADVQKVFVAIGNYNVGRSSFVMKNNVEIYGGFDPDNNIKTLDDERILPNRGTAEGSVLNGQNVRPVIWNVFTSGPALNTSAILDGFTVMNGLGDTDGGGIRNIYASPTLRNLVVKNNSLSSTLDTYGGGIFNSYYCSPVITNVVIKGNTAKFGGGLFTSSSTCEPVLTNVLIVDNIGTVASQYGGAHEMGKATYTNVTIAGNTGRQLYVNNSSTQLNNVIVLGGNTGGISAGIIQNSLISGFTSTSNGNLNATGITAEDIFTNPSAGDYTLKSNSVAIDAGDEIFYAGLDADTKDLAGNARVYQYNGGGVLDLGAYESSYSAFPYVVLTPDANGIIYVKETATGDMSGSSWNNATANLKKSIRAIGVQQVWAAVGTYPAYNIVLKNDVAVYGGFDPDNGIVDLTHNRILPNPDTNIQGAVINGQTLGRIITNDSNGLNSTAILDGFTLTNGRSTTGAGMYNNGASPTLRNLWIKGNTATSDGGAMYNINSASPVMTSITLSDNTARYGGGIFNRNSSSPVMTNVNIDANTASEDGGGMYNDVSVSPLMTNVSITGNSAKNGAGMYNRTNSSPVFVNALIADNSATGNGGAIRNDANSSPSLTNATVVGNAGLTTLFAPSGTTSFANSIVYGTVISGTYSAQYSLVQGSSATSNGNIDATGVTLTDIFTNPATGDYTLSQTSPVIDVGNNALNSTATDLAGNARIYNNAIIDLGAYEFHCASTIDFNNVVFTDSIITYDGNPHSIIAQNVPLGAAVTYEITDTNNQTISGNTATEAGIYIITATISDITTSCNTVIRTASLTINKAQSVITTNSTQTHVYDGTVKNVVATLNHNEATLVYTPQQGYTDVGTYPITVSAIETANYLAVTENVNLVIDNATITGVTFNNGTFTYDGTAHSIFASGVPAGATVTYTGNGQTNAGVYTVDALVQMPNYNDLQLSATMTIDNATITGVTFNNGTFTYDGTAHSIFASGAPAGATVTYTITDSQNNTQPGNSAVNVGVYTVTAIISMANYENLELQAILTIDTDLGVSEPDEEKDIFVYPNPFTDIIKVSKIENVKAIYVFDMSGRLIKRLAPSTELNLSNLSQQSYLLVLVMENGYRKPFKIIKK